MLVNVNSTAMANEATSILNPARALERAATTLASRLNSCSGMAGIDPMAEEFALGSKDEGGYDASVNSQLRGALGVASMIESFGNTLGATAKAYRDIEIVGANGASNWISAPGGATIGQYCPSVGTALGDEGLGTPGGEVMEFIENFLKDTAGIVIPTANTDRVKDAQSAWNDYAGTLDGIQSQVEALIPTVAGMEFPQSAQVLAIQTRLAQLVGDVASDGRGMAEVCGSYASNVETIRDELRSMLVQLAVEVALDIGIGIALSFVSFGAGALAGAAKAAATILKWVPRFASLINRLKTLVMTAKRTMAVLRRIAIEAIEGTVSGVAASTITGLSFGTFSWSNVGGSAIGGSVGGVFSGPFSNIGTRITSRAGRVATTSVVGGLTGAGGGVAGDFIASHATGQQFNLLMSALVGTAGGTAGGGLTNIKSPTLTVTTPGAPTPVSLSGTGSKGAGVGDTNVPTPGAATGGAGTGTGSSAPKVTTEAPTVTPGGSGGAPAAPGGGTTAPSPTAEAPTPPATLPTDAPTATPAPVDVTPAPVEVTPAPVDVTPAPVDVTPAPVDVTPAPVDVTPAPVDVTPAPVDVTPAPVDVTPAPVDLTPAPLDVTPAPVDVTPAPVEVAPAPVDVTPGDPSKGDIDTTPADPADGTDTNDSTDTADDLDTPVTPPADPADAPGTDPVDPAESSAPVTPPPATGATPPATPPHRLPPWIQQLLSPNQQEIIAGNHPGKDGWVRFDDSSLKGLINAYPPSNNPTHVIDPYGPTVDANNQTTPGPAADLLHARPDEPFGHDGYGGPPHTPGSFSDIYVDSKGNQLLPPNNGAVLGTRVQYTSLQDFLRDFGNLQIDRLGNPDNDFMGIGGGTLDDRGLPSWQMKAEVFSFIDFDATQSLPPGVSLEISFIADALGRDGGALQLVFVDATGKPMNLTDVLALNPDLFDRDIFGNHRDATDDIAGLRLTNGW